MTQEGREGKLKFENQKITLTRYSQNIDKAIGNYPSRIVARDGNQQLTGAVEQLSLHLGGLLFFARACLVVVFLWKQIFVIFPKLKVT